MASSPEKKIQGISNPQEQYFINDLRLQMKKLKNDKKYNLNHLYSSTQLLNKRITFLNNKVETLNQKVDNLKKEMTKKIEVIQKKVKKVHKHLFVSIVIFTSLTITLLILELFVFDN